MNFKSIQGFYCRINPEGKQPPPPKCFNGKHSRYIHNFHTYALSLV